MSMKFSGDVLAWCSGLQRRSRGGNCNVGVDVGVAFLGSTLRSDLLQELQQYRQ